MKDLTRRTRFILAALVALPLAAAGCDDDDDDFDDDIDDDDFQELVVQIDVDVDDPVLIDTDGDAIADSTVEAIRLDVERVELGFTNGDLLDMEVLSPTMQTMSTSRSPTSCPESSSTP
jgi:hypothetical protein